MTEEITDRSEGVVVFALDSPLMFALGEPRTLGDPPPPPITNTGDLADVTERLIRKVYGFASWRRRRPPKTPPVAAES